MKISARVYSKIHRASSQTFGQAASGHARPRSYRLQNSMPQIVSADCRSQRHYYCNSLNCICPCGHGAGKAESAR